MAIVIYLTFGGIRRPVFELGLSVSRVALRVSALKSGVTAQRAHRSQVWMPSTRVLWCYAVILTAARDRPLPPRDAAEPAVPVSSKPSYSRRTKAF